MLVLEIKTGNSIKIGDNIHVILTKVKGKKVKLAISAPPAIKIVRDGKVS